LCGLSFLWQDRSGLRFDGRTDSFGFEGKRARAEKAGVRARVDPGGDRRVARKEKTAFETAVAGKTAQN
jgi:hypothetical protein